MAVHFKYLVKMSTFKGNIFLCNLTCWRSVNPEHTFSVFMPTSPDELHNGDAQCWWLPHFSFFSCFSSTSMKRKPKKDCIITQSTAPGRLMSMTRNTMSSPWSNGAVQYSRIYPSLGGTKNITVHDIPLDTDAGTEVIQFIIQCLYIG